MPRGVSATALVLVVTFAFAASGQEPAPSPDFKYPTWDEPKDEPAPSEDAPPADEPQPEWQGPAGEPPDGDAPQQTQPGIELPDWNESRTSALTDKDIRAAIERGVAYLKGTRDEETQLYLGRYARGYPLGETALALLAFRYAGVGLTDPAFHQPFGKLLEIDSNHVYVNSLVAQVLATIPREAQTPDVRRRLNQVTTWLCRSQTPSGMWTYAPPRKNVVTGDNSNTQFAVLGLWQLAETGMEPGLHVLQRCEKHFLESQLEDGGWGYTPPRAYVRNGRRVVAGSQSTPSMTATGLATMYIFEDLLHLKDGGDCLRRRKPVGGRTEAWDRRVAAALKKVEADLVKSLEAYEAAAADTQATARARAAAMRDLYYLYSVERVAAASGQKYLGTIDWYARMAALLLGSQNADGSWGYNAGEDRSPRLRPIVETAFAVLLLAKGRAPVFINKLAYDGDWNNDPRDAANLTRYASRVLEQLFNWQVINIKGDVGGWFEAPLVMLSGTGELTLDEPSREKLKEYVAKGGCLMAVATCRDAQFIAAARKLGTELWPGLAWTRLADDHPIMTRQSHFDLEQRPELWGLTDAAGFTFFILSADDVACLWHQNRVMTQEDTFRFGINAVRYAARGKPVRSRLAD